MNMPSLRHRSRALLLVGAIAAAGGLALGATAAADSAASSKVAVKVDQHPIDRSGPEAAYSFAPMIKRV
jgi:ABC-type glycerol-3-phosphate transport system substrate-binding protein